MSSIDRIKLNSRLLQIIKANKIPDLGSVGNAVTRITGKAETVKNIPEILDEIYTQMGRNIDQSIVKVLMSIDRNKIGITKININKIISDICFNNNFDKYHFVVSESVYLELLNNPQFSRNCEKINISIDEIQDEQSVVIDVSRYRIQFDDSCVTSTNGGSILAYTCKCPIFDFGSILDQDTRREI